MTNGVYWAAPVKNVGELEAPPVGTVLAYALDREKSLSVNTALFFFVYKDGVWEPQSKSIADLGNDFPVLVESIWDAAILACIDHIKEQAPQTVDKDEVIDVLGGFLSL